MSGLFGGKPAPAPVVIPEPPPATPMPDQEALKRDARRKAAQAATMRGGRLSTALSDVAGGDSEKLG